jgi:hypothetical protein
MVSAREVAVRQAARTNGGREPERSPDRLGEHLARLADRVQENQQRIRTVRLQARDGLDQARFWRRRRARNWTARAQSGEHAIRTDLTDLLLALELLQRATAMTARQARLVAHALGAARRLRGRLADPVERPAADAASA